jgi:hypothetical protein
MFFGYVPVCVCAHAPYDLVVVEIGLLKKHPPLPVFADWSVLGEFHFLARRILRLEISPGTCSSCPVRQVFSLALS